MVVLPVVLAWAVVGSLRLMEAWPCASELWVWSHVACCALTVGFGALSACRRHSAMLQAWSLEPLTFLLLLCLACQAAAVRRREDVAADNSECTAVAFGATQQGIVVAVFAGAPLRSLYACIVLLLAVAAHGLCILSESGMSFAGIAIDLLSLSCVASLCLWVSVRREQTARSEVCLWVGEHAASRDDQDFDALPGIIPLPTPSSTKINTWLGLESSLTTGLNSLEGQEDVTNNATKMHNIEEDSLAYSVVGSSCRSAGHPSVVINVKPSPSSLAAGAPPQLPEHRPASASQPPTVFGMPTPGTLGTQDQLLDDIPQSVFGTEYLLPNPVGEAVASNEGGTVAAMQKELQASQGELEISRRDLQASQRTLQEAQASLLDAQDEIAQLKARLVASRSMNDTVGAASVAAIRSAREEGRAAALAAVESAGELSGQRNGAAPAPTPPTAPPGTQRNSAGSRSPSAQRSGSPRGSPRGSSHSQRPPRMPTMEQLPMHRHPSQDTLERYRESSSSVASSLVSAGHYAHRAEQRERQQRWQQYLRENGHRTPLDGRWYLVDIINGPSGDNQVQTWLRHLFINGSRAVDGDSRVTTLDVWQGEVYMERGILRREGHLLTRTGRSGAVFVYTNTSQTPNGPAGGRSTQLRQSR